MKLIIYRLTIFVLLGLLAISSGFLLVLGIIEAINIQADIIESIIYGVCYLLLLTFIILEIANTIVSIKSGSNFIQRLLYEKKEFNRPFYIMAFIFGILSLALSIYGLLIYPSNNGMFLSDSIKLIKGLLILFSSLITFDVIIILLFPLLAKEDKSFLNRKD